MSDTTVPPEVTRALAEFDALNAALVDGEYNLQDEINKLSEYIIDAAKKFFDIFMMFADTIVSGISVDLQIVLGDAMGKWMDRCTNFGELLVLSELVAQDAINTASDFTSNVLPLFLDDNKTMDEKRKAASDFMGTLDGRATQAQQMSQGFSDLRNSVSAFVTDLFNKLATYNQNDMEKQIQALDDAIAKLQTELKALKSTIDALTSQLEALENAIGVSSVLAAFVPAFWIDVAIKTAQAEDVKGQLQQTQKDHESKVADIANKEAQRASIQANMFSVPLVRAAMEKALPDTDLIQYKIGALATIWAALRADTQAIVEKLDYASDTNSQTLFKARVRTASGMYSTLQTALKTYKDYISSNLNLRSTLKQFHVDPDTGAVTPRTTDIPLPTTDTTSAAGSA